MFGQPRGRVICLCSMVLELTGVLTLSAFAQQSVIRFLTDETDPKYMEARVIC